MSFSVGAVAPMAMIGAARGSVSRCSGSRSVAAHGSSGVRTTRQVVPRAAAAASRGAVRLTQTSFAGDAGVMRAQVAKPEAATKAGANKGRSRGMRVVAQSFNSAGGIVPVPDRVIAFLPYFLPLFDGLRYSLYFFAQFPQLIFLIKPLEPIYSAFFRIPFSGMIAFFLIYFGIAENRDLSRFVRFNGMQAMMLDIILIVPGMLEYVVGSPSSMSGPLLMVWKLLYNCIWITVVCSFLLSLFACVTGSLFKVPFVGENADQRIF